MTGRVIVASIIVLLISSTILADINEISMDRRIALLTLVMGTYYKYGHEEDIVVVSDGRAVDAYTVTTIRMEWRRWGYSIVTTVTIPLEWSTIRSNDTVMMMVMEGTNYYKSSTLTIRRIR